MKQIANLPVQSFLLHPFNLEFSSDSTRIAGVSERDILISQFLRLFDGFEGPFYFEMVRDYEDLLFYKTVRNCIFDKVILNTADSHPQTVLNLAGIRYEKTDTRNWQILDEYPNYVTLQDGMCCKTFALTSLLDDLRPGWLYDLYQSSDAVKVYVQPVPEEKTRPVIANHRTAQMTLSSASKMDATANIGIIKELVLNKRTEKLFFIKIMMSILAKNPDELKKREQEFLQTTKNTPGIQTAKHVQAKLLQGIVGQKILVSTSAFAALVPFSTSEVYEEGGILLGENMITGNPVRWNINNRMNRNTVLAATSGSGKTTLAMMIIQSFEKMYPQSFIFGVDPENEYVALGQNMGFTYIDYSFGKKMGLDLFKMVPDTFAASETLCNALNIDDASRLHANKAAAVLAKMEISQRSFKKFYQILQDLQPPSFDGPGYSKYFDMLQYFEMLSSPPYSDFFEGQPPSSNKIILSLKNIGSAGGMVHRLITQIALSYAMGKALLMPKIIPKMIMLDEVWMLLQHQSLGNYIQNLSRRGRKYNINLMMATQNIEDMTGNVAAKNVLVNSDTVIFLRQSEATVSALKEHFVLSDFAVSFLMKLAIGQALIKYGNHMVPVNILPDKEQLELFRPR